MLFPTRMPQSGKFAWVRRLAQYTRFDNDCRVDCLMVCRNEVGMYLKHVKHVKHVKHNRISYFLNWISSFLF